MESNGGTTSIEATLNANVDLETIPIEEVLKQLKCTRGGLSSVEASNRLQIFGPNKSQVIRKRRSKILMFFKFMWNPMSWAMEVAAVMAIALTDGHGLQDFVGIALLLVINSTIGFIFFGEKKNNAGGLALKTKVLRDGSWTEQDAAALVPGDVIGIKPGDIVPADARLLEGDPLMIDDQSAATSESGLPVSKNPGDVVSAGSICKQGEIEAVVVVTRVPASIANSADKAGHFKTVLTTVGNFCICCIAFAMLVEIIVMAGLRHERNYIVSINNLLVLLIGGTPIAMPTVLPLVMAVGCNQLARRGVIAKSMAAIEEMAGIDVLCMHKAGSLTLNKLSIDKNLIEVFDNGIDKEHLILLAARASRIDNQDAIDAAIVAMLSGPEEARVGISEVHLLPFNSADKRTAVTYIDADGGWHRASKGDPVQILSICCCKDSITHKVLSAIDNFAQRGFRSLAVACQEVPERSKESPGGPWQFLGLLPLFDPPRHDSAENIRRAEALGINVKMITGDQLAIAKEVGRRIGMGANMYPSSPLLAHCESVAHQLPVDDLVATADGFAEVLPEHKCEIVKRLQAKGHKCGVAGDSVDDALPLKMADIGVAVANATDATRAAADIVLTEPGLGAIISAVLTSRAIFQRMKNYMIYAVSTTVHITMGLMLIAVMWRRHLLPSMVVIIAILNNGTIMTISGDRVKEPSSTPNNWKLREVFVQGILVGVYLAVMTVIFFWATCTDFFPEKFGVRPLWADQHELMAALYLHVSIVSQGLIFVIRSRGWFFAECPGWSLLAVFFTSQLVVTLMAVYAEWPGFTGVKGVGWGWAGVVWLYSVAVLIPANLQSVLSS